MKRPSNLDAERLRALFHYDPKTGEFTDRRTNESAGIVIRGGYVVIAVLGRRYTRAQLAWLYVTGEWSWYNIGRRDGNPGNDSFGNLVQLIPQPGAAGLHRRPSWKPSVAWSR